MSLFLCMVWGCVLSSLIYMQLSNFSSITYWRDCSLLILYSSILCWRLIDCRHMVLFLSSLFCSIYLYVCFCGNISTNKSKTKQTGTNQTYKLLYRKGNHKQSEKTMDRTGESICKWWHQQGLIPKIYKQLIQLNSNNNTKINKQLNLKNGQKT